MHSLAAAMPEGPAPITAMRWLPMPAPEIMTPASLSIRAGPKSQLLEPGEIRLALLHEGRHGFGRLLIAADHAVDLGDLAVERFQRRPAQRVAQQLLAGTQRRGRLRGELAGMRQRVFEQLRTRHHCI